MLKAFEMVRVYQKNRELILNGEIIHDKQQFMNSFLINFGITEQNLFARVIFYDGLF